MLGRLGNQNYRQGLRLGMGASSLGSRQQMHLLRSAAVAPNVAALNGRRMLNSYGAPPQAQGPSMSPFLPQAKGLPAAGLAMSPLARWLMAQR